MLDGRRMLYCVAVKAIFLGQISYSWFYQRLTRKRKWALAEKDEDRKRERELNLIKKLNLDVITHGSSALLCKGIF
jgi:hypothetical protein